MSGTKRLIEDFEYYFDNNNGGIEISGIKYSASEILLNLNRDAYQEEFETWLNIQESNNE
jgi:hypothetical protein